MALLAEEIVQEWLNRQGYFTIRGIKLGVQEIDLLAVKHTTTGVILRHVEVQVSFRPMGWLTVRNAGNITPASLPDHVKRWCHRKFDHPLKEAVRQALYPGT